MGGDIITLPQLSGENNQTHHTHVHIRHHLPFSMVIRNVNKLKQTSNFTMFTQRDNNEGPTIVNSDIYAKSSRMKITIKSVKFNFHLQFTL